MPVAALKLAIPAARISGWAVLAIGTIRLALPQRDVRQIDLAGDLETSAAGEAATAPSLARGPADAQDARMPRRPGMAESGLDPIGEGPEIGWLIRKNGPPWPAYCLDARLGLERPAPPDRHLCVFFGNEGANGASIPRAPRLDPIRETDAQGILCGHVWSLAADEDLVVEPLPGCLIGPRSPVIGLARFEKDVALVTDGAALAAYLAELKEAGHGRSR